MLRVDSKGDIYAEGVTSFCTPPLQRVVRRNHHGLQASIDRLPIIPRDAKEFQRHLPLLHRWLRLQGVYVGDQ